MKKLIDIPDEHIDSLKKIAKIKRQSVKAYMETVVIASTLNDIIFFRNKKSK